MSNYNQIRPFTEQETRQALKRIVNNPLLPVISRFFFPKKPINTLRKLLKGVDSIDVFQSKVMTQIVGSIIDRTTSDFTYSGLENLVDKKAYLAISNHRDITVDPALLQYLLLTHGQASTEICIGNNLLGRNKIISDMLMSNRMIKVNRGVSPRQLYLSSKRLSEYIRGTIVNERCAIWIAQREGRAKEGLDLTEPSIMKMFDLSGKGTFKENFTELNIIPMSISYEYEPCDAQKAREMLISRSNVYIKRRREDTQSIIRGLKQWKGQVHLNIDKPLDEREITHASFFDKKESYKVISQELDKRIIRGYKLFKTNYMGYDLMTGGSKYSSFYTPEDLANFKSYTDSQLSALEPELNRDSLRQIFFQIYGNPVKAKEKLDQRP